MEDFHFHKYHALGNDYMVIDPQHLSLNLSQENIQLICNRNFGIGSDGILYGPIFSGNDIQLRILNPDGSEAEKSGNGIRIFSRYLLDAGYVTDKTFLLKTLGGQVTVEILDDIGELIKVNMGKVTFWSNEIPVAGPAREVINEELSVNGKALNVVCLSIGNPHCVIPMEEISMELAMEIGPYIEKHPNFPNKINMQLLKIIDRQHIQIEIWERGAGYTMASGSSSCAAASAAYRMGLVDNNIRVNMPGGTIGIDIAADGHVFMTGSVDSVARGQFTKEFIKRL